MKKKVNGKRKRTLKEDSSKLNNNNDNNNKNNNNREYDGKLESGTDSRKKALNWGKNPERDFPGRCTIPINYDFVIAMIPLNYIFRECTRRYKLHKSQEKNQLSNVHERHKTVCQKGKRIGNPNTGSEDIQWQHRNGIWHRKCTMLIMKSGKRKMTERIELPN